MGVEAKFGWLLRPPSGTPTSTGNVRKGDADDRLTRKHPLEQRAARPIAQHREQPRNDQRFGERTRDQSAAGLFHEDRRIQERETQASMARRHPQGERAELRQPRPQRPIKSARQRGAHSRRAAVLVQETRERLAHHFLILRQIQIHNRAP
jgi:hypothetical protein